MNVDTDTICLSSPRPGDIGRVVTRHAEIYINEFGYTPGFEAYVLEAMAEFWREFRSDEDLFLVALKGDELVGSIALKARPENMAQLRFLYTEQTARGAGLGRRLVGAVIDHARKMGARGLVLDTASDLEAARGLYAASGFVLMSSEPTDWLPEGVTSEHWEMLF